MGVNTKSFLPTLAGAALGIATGGFGFGLTGLAAGLAGASAGSLAGSLLMPPPKAGVPYATSVPAPAAVAAPPAANAPTAADPNAAAVASNMRARAGSVGGGAIGAQGPQGLTETISTNKATLLGG